MKGRSSIFLFKIILQVVFFLYATSIAYSECIEGNCSSGQGTYTFASGSKYVGEFKDGKRHGQGTYTHANGDKYVGEWKDGKFHGQGEKFWANGDKYVGGFKDGELLLKGSEQ